jgi:hypothetical protein
MSSRVNGVAVAARSSRGAAAATDAKSPSEKTLGANMIARDNNTVGTMSLPLHYKEYQVNAVQEKTQRSPSSTS